MQGWHGQIGLLLHVFCLGFGVVWLWLFSQTRLGPGPRLRGWQVQEEGYLPPGAKRKAAAGRSAQAQRGRLLGYLLRAPGAEPLRRLGLLARREAQELRSSWRLRCQTQNAARGSRGRRSFSYVLMWCSAGLASFAISGAFADILFLFLFGRREFASLLFGAELNEFCVKGWLLVSVEAGEETFNVTAVVELNAFVHEVDRLAVLEKVIEGVGLSL